MKTIKMKNISRRNAIVLMLGTAGYLMSSKIVFAGKEQVLKRIDEITKGKGAKELDIFLDLPEIAENGNQVKVNFEIESEMTEENYIKNVYILADGNPAPDVAKFSFTPDMGMCSATTRIRLSKTQNVVLVAENNKNEYFMTKSKVKVTIGGCGG
jgi:sulfur-oxidizing protein SoxY|tara:strand:- start:504 stop:968 length:465 start_codon:yes stop_codon:yes gene_type:complete